MSKVLKNEPVGGHMIDLLLHCGHAIAEPIEAAVYAPLQGEMRYCSKCKRQETISRVGSMYWVEKTQ